MSDELKVRHAAEFLRCLETMDVEGIRRLWAHVSPHLPVPKTQGEWLYTMHMARSASDRVRLSRRQYSHRWLQERGFGSLLPEPLWPNDRGREQRSCVVLRV